MPASSVPDGLPPGRRGLAATAQLLAAGISTLDIAIANTALPAIAADLHTNPEAAIWIINAYQVALIATALAFAALGEIAGHKRVFLYGLVLFTLASLGCACSWSLGSLTIARIFQGVGGSAVMSVNAALIRFIYPEAKLGKGTGLNVLVVAVSLAIGPTVASLMLAIGPWPLLFAINIPIGLFALVLGIKTLPVTPRAEHRFDFILALQNACSFGLLLLGLTGAAHGVRLNITLPEIAAGLILGVFMLRRQAGSPAPMLPVDLFKIPVFALSTLTAVCAFATQSFGFVALPFFFEQVLGRSQIETGFLITPWPIAVAVSGSLAGWLSDRFPAPILGGAGLAALGLGMLLLAVLPANPSVPNIVWRMAICGAGFGLFQSPNLKMLMSSAPTRRAGGASGVITIARLFGQTVGAALVAFCFFLSSHHGPFLALVLGAIFAAAASIASLSRQFTPAQAVIIAK
jgi:DHA2 family multidrug resistance protein-like MFS transporter